MNEELLHEYRRMHETVLSPIAKRLEDLIRGHVAEAAHIDRVVARAKNPERFVAKAGKTDATGKSRYPEPLIQIQDIIGARVIVYYKCDVAPTEAIILNYFRPIELQTIVPDSEWSFGYFGRHFIMALPKDAIPGDIDIEGAPAFFELQIKTLFQHAWSEAEHDLGYKTPEELSADHQRQLAYTSAQAWGADEMFERLVAELA